MARSRLLQTLALLYYWQPEEIDNLTEQLLDQRKAAWRDALREKARLHGCPNASPVDPRREDLTELRAMCREDAKSIANTWKRDVDRQLERIYNENPRSNRQAYIRQMERWANARGQWKNLSIGLVTESSTRHYANTRFEQMNDLRNQRYIYVGPPPVSDNCVKRTAAGIVNAAYVRRSPVPNHPNCVHQWQPINPQRLDCEDIWVG